MWFSPPYYQKTSVKIRAVHNYIYVWFCFWNLKTIEPGLKNTWLWAIKVIRSLKDLRSFLTATIFKSDAHIGRGGAELGTQVPTCKSAKYTPPAYTLFKNHLNTLLYTIEKRTKPPNVRKAISWFKRIWVKEWNSIIINLRIYNVWKCFKTLVWF